MREEAQAFNSGIVVSQRSPHVVLVLSQTPQAGE